MSANRARKVVRAGCGAMGAALLMRQNPRTRSSLARSDQYRPFMQHRIGAMAAFALLAVNPVFADPVSPSRSMFIDAKTAQDIDDVLMGPSEGFNMDQLMELAGLSVASASSDYLKRLGGGAEFTAEEARGKRVLVICGPGNNGGDGLVAARHLAHFGFSPEIYIPIPEKNKFTGLTTQCRQVDIPILDTLPGPEDMAAYSLVVDAIFGYSFKGPVREAYRPTIAALATTAAPVLSVDLPSGWDVEKGDVYDTGFAPSAVVSLTAPKLCMTSYSGLHYVGGRFIPKSFAERYNFDIAPYGSNSDQHVLLNPQDGQKSKVSSGWHLYTSNDGYPYYFNHDSGQAEWAVFQRPESQAGAVKEPSSVMMVTSPDKEVAKKIARSLVEGKLAACVQLQDKVTSIYEWEGTVEESAEVLMIIKTRSSLVNRVTEAVKAAHPYDVPEVISLDISGGSGEYLDWIAKSTVLPDME